MQRPARTVLRTSVGSGVCRVLEGESGRDRGTRTRLDDESTTRSLATLGQRTQSASAAALVAARSARRDPLQYKVTVACASRLVRRTRADGLALEQLAEHAAASGPGCHARPPAPSREPRGREMDDTPELIRLPMHLSLPSRLCCSLSRAPAPPPARPLYSPLTLLSCPSPSRPSTGTGFCCASCADLLVGEGTKRLRRARSMRRNQYCVERTGWAVSWGSRGGTDQRSETAAQRGREGKEREGAGRRTKLSPLAATLRARYIHLTTPASSSARAARALSGVGTRRFHSLYEL